MGSRVSQTQNSPVSEPACVACVDRSPVHTAHDPCIAYEHSGCPLSRAEVGRAAWAYLHTMAAYYPEKPTALQQKRMHEFMQLMAYTYPCGYCADRTVEELERNPPRVKAQKELATWLCEVHNEVNDRIGKPLFDCQNVNIRWKVGLPECNL